MAEEGTTIACDWTAVHDALDGVETPVKVYGACTCPSPGYRLKLERADQESADAAHLHLNLVVEQPAEEMPDLLTPCGVEYEEISTTPIERVTIGGHADIVLSVMHPRDV
ncbi:MAG TPA: hypothetical protein VKB09_00650 [Thermomicrobiales bacterium]|nr:hypothetical protein [Thermomicrobiales bacterium]